MDQTNQTDIKYWKTAPDLESICLVISELMLNSVTRILSSLKGIYKSSLFRFCSSSKGKKMFCSFYSWKTTQNKAKQNKCKEMKDKHSPEQEL